MRHLRRAWVGLVGTALLAGSAFAQPTPTFLERDPAAPVAVDTVSVNDAHWGDHHLRRAAVEFAKEDLDGVVRELTRIDFQRPIFPEADRAAFLLAYAYVHRGDAAGVRALADRVSAWPDRSPYTDWVRLLALTATAGIDSSMTDTTAPDGSASGATVHADPLATAVVASVLASSGRTEELRRLADRAPTPLVRYVLARAVESEGGDARAEWRSLAAGTGEGSLDVELRAVAHLTLATTGGSEAARWLAGVPETSRHHAEAQHRLARLELAGGDTAAALTRARHVFDAYPGYAGRHELGLLIASVALNTANWPEAHDVYRRLDTSWQAASTALDQLTDADVDSMWRAWSRAGASESALFLDANALLTLTADAAARAVVAGDAASLPAPAAVALPSASPPPLPMPPLADWIRAAESASDVAATRADLAQALADAATERARWTKRLRYLDLGYEKAREEMTKLLGHRSVLDSINASLDQNLRSLEELRDEAIRRLTARADAMRDRAAAHRLWMDAMAHFFVEGANVPRTLPPPGGMPSESDVLVAERAFLDAIEALSDVVSAKAPGVLTRSFEENWRPSIIDRARALAAHSDTNMAALTRVTQAIEGELLANAESPGLSAKLAEVERLRAELAVAADRHRTFRRRVVERQIASVRADLLAERESILYGVGAATYALAVSPGFADSTVVDSAAMREESIAALKAFLAEYDNEAVRGDVRFRLADLELSRAREEFQERMARFLAEQGMEKADETTAFLPFVDYGPALELYLAILEEDPGFEHRDAALFNAAMILSDQADPRATELFSQLIDEHPESQFRQQAYLRVGDTLFGEKQFVRAVPYFENAAAGEDPGFTAIALYKLGWSHFSVDDFVDAADAFRRLMDHYDTERDIRIDADLSDEAEDYFIHSLARAGGAPVFMTYMDGIGPRPYEKRVLQAMAQLFRRFSLDDDAIEADQLWISRYPNESDALTSVERMVDTFERSGRKTRAREVRLAYAPRFIPGSEWHAANDDTTRAKGEAFARSSWKHVALYHHQRARSDSGQTADWVAAREYYEAVLRVWPADREADRMHFFAGEAAANVDAFDAAITHYHAASSSDSLPLAKDAAWQETAITDTWYERTRVPSAAEGTTTGADSLAKAVIGRSLHYVARFPEDPRGADLLWRSGQLAFAHGWYADAAEQFQSLERAYPGDSRVPQALALCGDAFYELAWYDDAGAAYEVALPAAKRAGADSLVARLTPAIPITYYKHAESIAAAKTTTPLTEANAWSGFSARFPTYEHAHHAQYRAALKYVEADSLERAVESFQRIIDVYGESEYVRDAHLQIASTWQRAGRPAEAAARLEQFSELYPEDDSADDALLQAADLYTESGRTDESERLELRYVDRFPEDTETSMQVLAKFARRDLEAVARGDAAVASLLAPPATAEASPSNLSRYLSLAAAHPELADAAIAAETRFLEAERTLADYDHLAITLPIKDSIERKKTALEATMAAYGRVAEVGVSEWSHAAAFRIGQALIGFGKGLEQSERPSDLSGEDLAAYDEVLLDQAWEFYDRGENVWSDLLRQKQMASEDPGGWLTAARTSLWPRLAARFLFHAETEFPLVQATPPDGDTIEATRAAVAARVADVASRADAPNETTTN